MIERILLDSFIFAVSANVVAINGLNVTNGLFTVVLDFGELFTGDARWLGTSVQCSGDGGFTY